MKLGRYEVVRELGKGAMGVVYLAKDPLIGRLVALKTIRTSMHSDDDEAQEFQQRFVREAQAAGILNHPAIVTVHDIGQDETSSVSFIAMEYVEGQNLKEVLAQGRALGFDQINDIIVQVADALDFAHAKGIVHRDVKPANVILVEGKRAKITDFGIAKIASSSANLTSTGQFLGTPNYMAPEQIKGLPVDGRSDLFSLGICLYECLTRRKPFGGDSLTTISYKIVHEPFTPLREINPQIPEGYDEVVAKSLAKDPARRYQRGRDFAAALRAVARGERPVQNEPVLADETVVTHHLERGPTLPTLDVPFPEAEVRQEPARSVVTQAAKMPVAAVVAGNAGQAAPADEHAPTARRKPADRLRTTFSNVRTAPLWKRPVHPAIFFSIVLLLVIALAAALSLIQRGNATVPAVDRAAEIRRARERQLRIDGNRFIQQRRFAEARAKYSELARLSPRSPAVIMTLGRLDAVQQQEQLTTQQSADTAAKLQQGIALFNEKKYAEAIPLLQESFSRNPGSEDAANYLKMAQQEEEKRLALLARAAQAQQRKSKQPVKAAATAPLVAPVVGPARLTTRFQSPFKDGYLMVKVGGDVVAHENLFEQGKGVFKRRAGRSINVSKEFPAKNADLDVWVVVQPQGVQERHTIRANFAPGGNYTLTVSYNAASKVFDYRLE